MKIVFCGTVVPKTNEHMYDGHPAEANQFQISFIKALQAIGHEVKLLSFVPFSVNGRLFDKSPKPVKCDINYMYLKENANQTIEEYKKTLKEMSSDCDMIIAYECTYTTLNAVEVAKKTTLRTVLLQPGAVETPHGFNERMYVKAQLRGIGMFQSVVGLSDAAATTIKKGQHYICMKEDISSFTDECNETEENAFKERVSAVMQELGNYTPKKGLFGK